MPGITLYGVDYEGQARRRRPCLPGGAGQSLFAHRPDDHDGRAGIDWGVYGVPETYVVDGKGIVRFKHGGTR